MTEKLTKEEAIKEEREVRLIDANALKEVLIKEKGFYPAMVASAIENAPTIRCDNCEEKTEKEKKEYEQKINSKQE
jgi:hypothetical protein